MSCQVVFCRVVGWTALEWRSSDEEEEKKVALDRRSDLTGMSKVGCYHKSRDSEEAASQSRFKVENHSTTVQAGQANGKVGQLGKDMGLPLLASWISG